MFQQTRIKVGEWWSGGDGEADKGQRTFIISSRWTVIVHLIYSWHQQDHLYSNLSVEFCGDQGRACGDHGGACGDLGGACGDQGGASGDQGGGVYSFGQFEVK